MSQKPIAAKILYIAIFALMIGCGSDQSTHDSGTLDGGVSTSNNGSQDAGESGDLGDSGDSPDANAEDIGGEDGQGGGEDAGGYPSAAVDEVRSENPLEVDEARRAAARAAYEALDKDALEASYSPEALYDTFNEFALSYFGPTNQPLLQKYTGETLDFVPAGDWLHASSHSATIAFETTLPVRGAIEYGTSPDALTESVDESERYFFTQVHHLRGLQPDTTYYYRRIARGESGETLVSTLGEFKTGDLNGVIELPGQLAGPPYMLDQAGATYVLTEDIISDGTALAITASDVTVDLNGHRIVYANVAVPNPDAGQAATAASGIWARSNEVQGVRVLNGIIEEGHVGNNGSNGVHAIYLSGVGDVEIAGVSVLYQAAQVFAVFLRYPKNSVRLHHNNFMDRGFEILNRHGSGGGRPVQITDSNAQNEIANDYEFAHNLVKRTRQNGLRQANSIRDNEIYVDSWSTNSFAIQPHSRPDTPAGEVRRNKIFLSGYHSIALGWAHLDLSVEQNLVQLESVRTESRRYFEDWGDMDSLNGFRITNYGGGGQVRENLHYRDNVIVGRARDGAIMRGTELFSDATITNTIFEDNYVNISAEDPQTLDAAPVVTQGVHATRPDHNPTFYIDNMLVSNLANIRFGDSYGRGNRHTFIGTKLVKTGDHPDYHTIVFDGAYESYDHELIDPVFEGGAAVDDVWWRRVSIRAYYRVKWTVALSGAPGESVSIKDVDGQEVYSGALDAQGNLEVALAQMTIRPTEWSGDDSGGAVGQAYEHQKVMHTPHKITVGGVEQSVTVDGLGKRVDF